jgi:hypothetical protein
MTSTTSLPPRASASKTASPGKSQIGLVRENAKEYATSGDIRHGVRYGLGHGVDRVRSPRISNVDDEVGHHVGAAGISTSRTMRSCTPPPSLINIGSCWFAISIKDERAPEEPEPSRIWIGDIDQLNLRLHDRPGTRSEEAALDTRDACGVTGGRDNRWLLGRHRHQNVSPVDGEVTRYADGNPEDPDGILDHVIGLLQTQP